MGDITLYTVLPNHTAEAGITLASVGVILSVNRAVRLVFNGPAGMAYDRWPRRRIFVPSLFLAAISTASYAAFQGFWPLLLGRVLWGLAWSGIWIGGCSIILDVTDDHDRGHWTGMYQTWFFLGVGVAGALGGWLTDWLGYDAAFWIGATLTLLGALVAWASLPETHQPAAMRAQASSTPNGFRWYTEARLWTAFILQGINRFTVAGVFAGTVALLVNEKFGNMSLALGVGTLTGLITAGRTLTSTVAAPLGGRLSDRLGNRWLVVLGVCLAGAVGMFMAGWANYAIILTGIFLAAGANGSLQALATALTGDMVEPARRGRAISLLYISGDLGSALGPLFAYALLPVTGLDLLYWICAGIFLLGAILTLSTYRSSRQSVA